MGKRVEIIPTNVLKEMRLSGLSHKNGEIVSEVKNKKGDVRGSWVALEEPYLGEIEWFFPASTLRIIK